MHNLSSLTDVETSVKLCFGVSVYRVILDLKYIYTGYMHIFSVA